ncbi:MAG: hypothetical protein AMS18_00415 [Gemmatimonas sp. SG8_17]|nr:MAG: hypothetical protein AMS18_00415 [Gemmatimonas sp. SG8_17]
MKNRDTPPYITIRTIRETLGTKAMLQYLLRLAVCLAFGHSKGQPITNIPGISMCHSGVDMTEAIGYWCSRCGTDIFTEAGKQLLEGIADALKQALSQEPDRVFIPPLGVVVEEWKSTERQDPV